MSSTRKRIIVIFVVLATLLLYPLKTTLVPAQHVLVVTEDMHPVKDALVRQIWKDYSLEHVGHEEDLPTDLHGRITFPARTVRASLLRRMIGPLASIAGQGIHASFGVHTDMFPLANRGTEVSSEIVQPQPGEIVYRLRV
jgi:hypothetical protein